MRIRHLIALVAGVLLAGAGLYVLRNGAGGVPPVGTLLDPVDGLYRTARRATPPPDSTRLQIAALDRPVTIVRDRRGVPHIFAQNEQDATVALGYVVAQDRLFQIDFITRVAAGTLSEAFGPSSIESDRFLRATGMDWGARKNVERIRENRDVEWDLVNNYAAGVNAYLDQLAPADLPFEFRLLGYEPQRFTPVQAFRVLQYMSYDLTYRTDQPSYAVLKKRLGEADYQALYPRDPAGLYVPIIPSEERGAEVPTAQGNAPATHLSPEAWKAALAVVEEQADRFRTLPESVTGGGFMAKGSNNWAVHGTHSASGAPLLANDMHLGLTLPAVWYEAHLVTPTMNMYGLAIPGAPVLVQGFNEHLGWAYTNTGSDQIDHYALQLDESGRRYRYEGSYRDLRVVLDTIRVKGAAPVVDTLYYSHFGPVRINEDDTTGVLGAVATQWVAHKQSRTLRALWEMNHATNLKEFEDALRYWDTPMQNILYAGKEGHIAIRSAGYLPVRKAGHGRGLLDGTTDAFAWTGRVPFEELPYARDPSQGYLASSNQKPTGPSYPHYLGHDWRDGYRSLRLDTLLSRKPQHSVADFRAYQADVDVMQRDVFVPLLAPLTGLSPRADRLRDMLRQWEGRATVDRSEPLVMDEFMDNLHRLAWDERVFEGVPDPEDAPFVQLLRTDPSSPWFDVQATPEREDAAGLLALALEATADTLEAHYGWSAGNWRWGDHHHVLFRHITQTPRLRPLWRGPFQYPGFRSTVSPAGGRPTTHSASQRLIVDFSQSPPEGIEVYPGGQSGDPLDARFYDLHIPTYLSFRYYDLLTPAAPEDLSATQVRSTLELLPRE